MVCSKCLDLFAHKTVRIRQEQHATRRTISACLPGLQGVLLSSPHDMSCVVCSACRYGGNPVCSAGGRAVLRVVDQERRQEHCAEVGGHLLTRLRQLQAKHDIIGDVRGKGLMIGVEMVKDRNTKVSLIIY